MLVEKWMTLNPITVDPRTTVSAAAVEMGRHKLRHILVAEVSSAGKILAGIISKYDIARAFPANFNPFSVEVSAKTVPTPVSAIMTRNVITVAAGCAIDVPRDLCRECSGAHAHRVFHRRAATCGPSRDGITSRSARARRPTRRRPEHCIAKRIDGSTATHARNRLTGRATPGRFHR